MKISILVLSLLAIAQLSLALQIQSTHNIQHQFCWKDSYGRGVGTIPNDCGKLDKIGLLCYNPCPSGYRRFGFDCHQICPKDFRDDGLFCRHAQYGRGAGFPWKGRDGIRKKTRDNGMFSRCEAQHGKGNCEKSGAIVYPKCKAGYKKIGCCICRPQNKPDCLKLGMNKGIDLSCAKKIQIGTPHPASCPPGKQNNAGLCYAPCNKGYYGVGPVCWGSDPQGWVGCGMGSAKNSKVCRDVIIGQISSVGQIAMNIATLGSSGAATGAANAAKNTAKVSKLKKQLDTLKAAVKGNKQISKVADAAKKAQKAKKNGEKLKQGYDKAVEAAQALDELNTLKDDNVTDADIVRISAQIAALADPTGIASTIEAYSHPKCSQIFKR